MRVSRIQVRNFRLLRDVSIEPAADTTVLVGRNNSGKTTLAELFTSFLDQRSPRFTAADFSSETYVELFQAWRKFVGGDEEGARSAVPVISLTVTIEYDKNTTAFGPLSAAIVDLDPECTKAELEFKYALKTGGIRELFQDVQVNKEKSSHVDSLTDPSQEDVAMVMKEIKGRINALYERTITALDPQDQTNTRPLGIDEARKIISVHFLKAQRGLDDEKEKPKDLIGKLFQSLFDGASKSAEGSTQKNIADDLSKAVSEVEETLGANVSQMFKGLVPTLEIFGYPGLKDPGIQAVTNLDVSKLLADHTRIRYEGHSGISLPESYSGLGSRNLILILMTILSYYREYSSRDNSACVHLIFVEEPEAHLHPQMQEVFIERLAALTQLFPSIEEKKGQSWSPQFIVSTHSSHIANRAPFSNIRYFRVNRSDQNGHENHSEVLDLSKAPGLSSDFLHQYLTLTRSDLFFADKAILVEGTSERLIVPAAIRKCSDQIASQYVTLMEVGGAYAHIFFPLLDFLKIPALIITDIDTVGMPADADSAGKKSKTNRLVAVPVHRGEDTSNATIKQWFEEKSDRTPSTLFSAFNRGESKRDDRYIAYQIPEQDGGPCGRSFEDAFVLANPDIMKPREIIAGESGDPDNAKWELTGNREEVENLVMEYVSGIKKSDFALKYAIEYTEWKTPRYIQLGLDWLLKAGESNENFEQSAGNGNVVVS